MRSSFSAGFIEAFEGIKDFPSFPGITCTAPSNFILRSSPISRNDGTFCQQVFNVQEPESPWHLQTNFILFFTACKKRMNKRII
jgi:hypothetical protein